MLKRKMIDKRFAVLLELLCDNGYIIIYYITFYFSVYLEMLHLDILKNIIPKIISYFANVVFYMALSMCTS